MIRYPSWWIHVNWMVECWENTSLIDASLSRSNWKVPTLWSCCWRFNSRSKKSKIKKKKVAKKCIREGYGLLTTTSIFKYKSYTNYKVYGANIMDWKTSLYWKSHRGIPVLLALWAKKDKGIDYLLIELRTITSQNVLSYHSSSLW